MPSINVIAARAGVSPENVIRFLNGDPLSVALSERVEAAIAALGQPAWPNVPAVNQETSIRSSERQPDLGPDIDRPETLGSLVYEALRVEVGPVAQNVQQMQTLVDGLVRSLAEIRAGVNKEREERLDDLALLTELIVTGWRTVDRRLARLERALEERPPQSPRGSWEPLGTTSSGAKAGVRRITVERPPGDR